MKYLEIELNDKNKGYLEPDTNKSEITFINNFLDKKTTEKLFNNLTNNTPWEQGVYKMFGKDVKTPRLLWAMRDDKFDIEKSYTVTGSSIWNKDIENIKTRVEEIIKKNIKYAQINYYRDGNDYIGWHTDSK